MLLTASRAKGEKQNFHFAACSGARLFDMAAEGGGKQVQKTGKPYLVTMTAGGNDAGFFSIARDCIYQQDPRHDYGPDYPDKNGDCFKSVQGSHDYINGAVGSLERDMTITLQDILNTDNAKAHLDFLLYLTGYARFFAVADGDGKDWCDGESFGAIPLVHQPKLTKVVRRAINGLTTDLNNLYSKIMSGWTTHHGMRYVDIDAAFDGHRFCEEPTDSQKPWWHSAQYYGDFVHIWNLSPPQLDTADASKTTVQMPPPDGLTYSAPTAISASSGSGGENSGSALRPFHPKPAGYTGIKDAIIAQMKKDNAPETEPSCTDPKKGVSPSIEDAKKMNDALDKAGDGVQCVSGDGECANLKMTSMDGVSVDMCTKGPKDSIGCAQAANYLAGIITTCSKDGMVSGTQNINGHPGLSIQI